ncbi:Wall-associated kinase family protein [Rhynchospora pubera]|uniref:Wall-associated kinase family protein n=1 Tax=Rhynchospora pubera TaxID=906938 RepID=A0AAV8ATA9_9POAL|nr:Wall-associated kinase family protein [Rhynchospora pubera]
MQAVRTANTVVALLHLFLLLAPSKTKATESSTMSLPGCPDNCSGIPIPYPFGLSPNCSLSDAFEVSCNTTNYSGTSTSTPYWHERQVLDISLSLGELRVTAPISYQCYNTTTKTNDYIEWSWNLSGSAFVFNYEKNKFVVIGCDTLAYVQYSVNLNQSNYYWGACGSWCYGLQTLTNGSTCSGIGCSQTVIPKGINYFYVSIVEQYNNSEIYNFSRCGYAMVMEPDNFTFNTRYITTDALERENLPLVIDWFIDNTTCNSTWANESSYACKSKNSECVDSISGLGYFCNCSRGYQGNPYLEGGCQDINECVSQQPCSQPGKCYNTQGGYRCSCPFGWQQKEKDTCEPNLAVILGTCASIIPLLFLVFGVYVILERRKLSKVMKKYFDQYGGWILLEKIKSSQGFGFTIYTKQQVEQATNNFDSASILGQGGHGTVYKGSLSGQTVAIKKCKMIDENKKKEFGKEMLILSQINHKNIVKLLGCCLEVEVPMLVYEFIPNGTLLDYINNKRPGSHISLATRLRIAQESAEALAYLHSSASPPILHGDVKSTNILSDKNYMAKVSDFGASTLAPTDESEMATLVQGTCGYLDPEYLQSCKLSDKSDVYSFGVVILELLTSKPVIDFGAPEEEIGLSSRFLIAMEEKKINELLDDEIKCEDHMEVIMEVAELAKECLNMKGAERPTMKEVAEELERICKIMQHPWREDQYHPEELETLLSGASHVMEIEQTSSFSLEKQAGKSIAVGR